jgi:hypothetical protein
LTLLSVSVGGGWSSVLVTKSGTTPVVEVGFEVGVGLAVTGKIALVLEEAELTEADLGHA